MNLTQMVDRSPMPVIAVWLLFLAFPLSGVASSAELSPTGKAICVGLIVLFAVVYLQGFRVGFCRGVTDPNGVDGAATARVGVPYLISLCVIALVLYWMLGVQAIGVLPFVGSFAGFHFRPGVALGITGTAAAVAVVVPLVTGFEFLWFMGLIVVAVGVGGVLIRAEERRSRVAATLDTQLATVSERNRISRDVHDVLGHSLTAITLKADLARKLLAGVTPVDAASTDLLAECQHQLDELVEVSRRSLSEIRATVRGFRDPDLGDELAVARVVLADAEIEFELHGDVADVAEDRRTLLAWVVRESVTNVVRHSGASRCCIELTPADSPVPLSESPVDGPVWLRVSNDGPSRSANSTGMGLLGLSERAQAAGARLQAGLHNGFVVEVVGPLSEVRL